MCCFALLIPVETKRTHVGFCFWMYNHKSCLFMLLESPLFSCSCNPCPSQISSSKPTIIHSFSIDLFTTTSRASNRMLFECRSYKSLNFVMLFDCIWTTSVQPRLGNQSISNYSAWYILLVSKHFQFLIGEESTNAPSLRIEVRVIKPIVHFSHFSCEVGVNHHVNGIFATQNFDGCCVLTIMSPSSSLPYQNPSTAWNVALKIRSTYIAWWQTSCRLMPSPSGDSQPWPCNFCLFWISLSFSCLFLVITSIFVVRKGVIFPILSWYIATNVNRPQILQFLCKQSNVLSKCDRSILSFLLRLILVLFDMHTWTWAVIGNCWFGFR